MYKSQNIILIGFKGANKTEVAKRLAEMFSYRFIDIDDMIENLYQRETGRKLKYRDISKHHGEAYFQQMERKALERIKGMTHIVLGTAGNTPFDPNARRILRRMGQVIFMRAGPEIIFDKMTEKGVPYFLDENDLEGSFARFYAKGINHFQNTADLIVWVKDLTTEQMAEKINNEIEEVFRTS